MTEHLIVMVGLQGSGKTTKANCLAKIHNAVVLSSDETRKLYPDWDNQKVFEYLYEQTKRYLLLGKKVIFDATNTTIKARKNLFNSLKGFECNVSAYVMTTPYEVCVERVKARNQEKTTHYVPLDVLDKYYQSFQIPFFEEGFDKIVFDGWDFTIYPDHKKRIEILNKMNAFDQKNEHHDFLLLEHCKRVVMAGVGLFEPCMYLSALWHDVGKLFTQTIKDGVAHYYNHANVGTYFLLSNLDILSSDTITQAEASRILFYINYHMLPFTWNTEKAKEKWKNIFGETAYRQLLEFNRADNAGAKKSEDLI